MVTFTQLLSVIADTNPDKDRKYHVLAARYYLGAEGNATTFRRTVTEPQPVHRAYVADPYLTVEDADEIIRMR